MRRSVLAFVLCLVPVGPVVAGPRRVEEAPAPPAYSSDEERTAVEMRQFARIDRDSITLLDRIIFGHVAEEEALAQAVREHLNDFIATYAGAGEAAQRRFAVITKHGSVYTGAQTPWEHLDGTIGDRCGELADKRESATIARGYLAAQTICELFRAAVADRGGDPASAESHLKAARALVVEARLQPEIAWKIDYVAGWVAYSRKDEPAAFDAWYKAIQAVEAYRAHAPLADLRQGYLVERLDLYAIAEVVGRRNGDPRWFELAELQRARIFLETMRGAATTTDRLGTPVTLAATQQALGEGEAFLWYEVFNSELRAVLVTKDAAVAVPLRQQELTLRDLANRVYTSASDASRPFDTVASADLYGRVLAPVVANADFQAAHVSHLFVQPHPWLAQLPLEVLVEPAPGPGRPRYVADSLAVTYLPSCATLVWLRSRPPRATARHLVAVGDPDFGRGLGGAHQAILQSRGIDVVAAGASLPALPNTRHEVAAAEAVFSQRKFAVSALVGPDATESRLRAALAAGPSHLIIATHGVYQPGSLDSEPVIFLGQPDAGADGVLRSSEVYGIPMDVDVVVLSACQTGLGRGVAIEGILGFPRAFLSSGARNVVVSQWPVDDDATSRWMAMLYARLAAGEPVSSAIGAVRREWLRTAKGTDAHPSRWASFVHFGG